MSDGKPANRSATVKFVTLKFRRLTSRFLRIFIKQVFGLEHQDAR
jgi:hypothetical protein